MRIWHLGHIGLEHKAFLEAHSVEHRPWFSVKYPTQIRNYIFKISEDSAAFPKLKCLVSGKYTRVYTSFSDDERRDAEWCIMRGEFSLDSLRFQRYAWSEEFFRNQCKNCGSGWEQIASLQLKREPELDNHQFCGFGSGFELFCTPVVLEEFSRRGFGGFETWPLMLGSTGQPIERLKQIMVTEVAEPAVAEELVEHERYSQTVCPVCGQIWHAYYIRGILPMRRAALKPDADFQLTNEWFGNGRTARREILISRRAVQLILDNKWQGAELTPIQAV